MSTFYNISGFRYQFSGTPSNAPPSLIPTDFPNAPSQPLYACHTGGALATIRKATLDTPTTGSAIWTTNCSRHLFLGLGQHHLLSKVNFLGSHLFLALFQCQLFGKVNFFPGYCPFDGRVRWYFLG